MHIVEIANVIYFYFRSNTSFNKLISKQLVRVLVSEADRGISSDVS